VGYSVIKYDLGAVLPKVTESTPGGVINSLILPECMTTGSDGTRYPCGTDTPKSHTVNPDGEIYESLYKLELWTETAHTAARDEPSRLVFLEDFTRRNIAVWLTKDGIETAAYDLAPSVEVLTDSRLISRCAEATKNFNDIFQPDRWQVVPHSAVVTCHVGAGSDQAGDHNYWFETWQEGTRPNPTAMNDALTRIFGKIIGAFERDPWLEQVWEVIKRVPRYSGPCCGPNYNSAPYVGLSDGTVPMLWPWTMQPEAPSKYFWRIVNGKIEPSAWTKDFLDAFAPSKMASISSLTKVTAKKKATKKTTVSRVPMLVTKSGGMSITKIAVIGAGAVVGVGVLWWLFV